MGENTQRDINGTVGKFLYGLYLFDIIYYIIMMFINYDDDTFVIQMNLWVLSGYMHIYMKLNCLQLTFK